MAYDKGQKKNTPFIFTTNNILQKDIHPFYSISFGISCPTNRCIIFIVICVLKFLPTLKLPEGTHKFGTIERFFTKNEYKYYHVIHTYIYMTILMLLFYI